MVAPHLVEINELPVHKLCNFIDTKHYHAIIQAFSNVEENLDDLQNTSEDADKVEMVAVLFYRIKDEVQQLIRNDRLIIFPLVKKMVENAATAQGKVPVDMVHSMNKKILTLLDRMRHILNDFIARPDWSQGFRIFCDELHNLEQHVLQAIYLKENVLLPKVVRGLE